MPHPNSAPYGIAEGPNKKIWFTEINGNRIGHIANDGTICEYELPHKGSFPSFITAETDNALWFTENQNNAIGRITESGEITEFKIPTPASGPVGITKGNDGALWFVEINGNKWVESLLPVISLNMVKNARPLQPGPETNCGLHYGGANQIGRMKSNKTIEVYSILTPHAEPHGISSYDGKTIWFALECGKIGKLTLKNDKTE